jgi:PLD-like domain
MSDLGISDEVRTAFDPVLKALAPARQSLLSIKDVAAVRPGYFHPASGRPVPAVLVAVTPGTTPISPAALAQTHGVPFAVVDATVDEQLAAASAPAGVAFAPGAARSGFEALLTGERVPEEFAPPRSGAYEPLEPSPLVLVNEKMKITLCVSPEAGWGELKDFLAGTRERLTIGMYQFTAPHVFEAVRDVVKGPGRHLELVLHPIPEPPAKRGTKANDLREKEDVLAALEKLLKDRFRFSWATLASKAHPDGLWASAYHIKVAVRDGKAFWLSSGNWQSSNQPPFRLFASPPDKLPSGFQRKYNREYHAIVENEKLAVAYETYLKRDRTLTAAQGAPEPFSLPDLFVAEEPEEAVAFAEPPQFFKPLRIDRKVKVQPLLTPDNYVEHVLPLIRSAKKSVWFQNQYINFRGTGEDFNDFKLLVAALKKQIDDGRDVRIICRDLMKQESVDVLVALGFPREVMRFQPACHNKTILVDGKVALFGSHNWSNEGVKTNRDASLIFFDREVAEYLGEVFDYDWNRLATAKPTPPRIRVARPGERTPPGFQRVPFSAVFED